MHKKVDTGQRFHQYRVEAKGTASLGKYYLQFTLSDSGDVQELATALDKPGLVLRKIPKQPEVVTSSVAKLIGMVETQRVQ